MLILPWLVLALALLSALFSATETAVFALARMDHTRRHLSRGVQLALRRLIRSPLETLLMVVGLNEVANVFMECLATLFFLYWLGDIGPYVAVPVMLAVVLLLCDITPKTFALGFPAPIARLTARPLAAIVTALHPVAGYLRGPAGTAGSSAVSESEFKALLRLSEHQGEVAPSEAALIHRVFDFGARRVSEVMTRREGIFSLDIATPIRELVAQVAHGHYSRVPVYRDRPDNIVGILRAKDLVARRLDRVPPRVERLLRTPVFVPPGKTLGELFEEMRRGRFQLALVVNEYGRLLGLVTLEDLLEELFGEIRDEFELEIPDLKPGGDGEWIASGAIELDRLRKKLGNGIPAADRGVPTLSSLVLRRLGRVPRTGDQLRLGEFQAIVERVKGATVEVVRLRR